MKQFIAIVTLAASAAHAAPLSADTAATLQRISANSLRGHLSFIASDLLEGRASPSRGLDLAAEYIAAQFRRAGLEALGDDGYFQTANWTYSEPNLNSFSLVLDGAGQHVVLKSSQISFGAIPALAANAAAVVKADFQQVAALEALGAGVAGKVVVCELPAGRITSREQYEERMHALDAFMARVGALKPLFLVMLDRGNPNGDAGGNGRLIDPEKPAPQAPLARVTLHGMEAQQWFDALPAGAGGATLTLKLAAPTTRPVKLRNVAAILRGSDPALKDSYVLVTAHYDHLGMRSSGDGDIIYNGANDDGSGTVSVIEIASAMAAMKLRPKRSVVFMTVFGEERGLLGSRYYGRHPLVPIARTVADINLEQVGRTDSSEGPQMNNVAMTGMDYSDVGRMFAQAGEQTGIKLYKHAVNSDLYFGQSDNQALADQGVPAHTLSVAYAFPDYHKVGDHWDKIDYDNMAKVDRMIALGVLMIANDKKAPQWNAANPKTATYVEAWKKLAK